MTKYSYNISPTAPIEDEHFGNLETVDSDLLESYEINNTFDIGTDFIVANFYELDNTLIHSDEYYENYSIVDGGISNNPNKVERISIDVEKDVKSYSLANKDLKVSYNFLNNPYTGQRSAEDFYIEAISPDKTEVRVVSLSLDKTSVKVATDILIKRLTESSNHLELRIYTGDTTFRNILNVSIEEYKETYAVLLKLYKPLNGTLKVKDTLSIVEHVSDPIAFEVNVDITVEKVTPPTLKGANFNVAIEVEATAPSQYLNYEELFSSPTTNTNRELSSKYNEKSAKISIDYTDFENFINFSSATERLANFKYKLQLLESHQANIDIALAIPTAVAGVASTQLHYEKLIKGIVDNFDHYEKHLYFEKGDECWPKAAGDKPYVNLGTSTTVGATTYTWYNNMLKVADSFDASNPDLLLNTVPSFLRDDSANAPYEMFIHMIAQHFDNLWIYTKNVNTKYNADNRLDTGVSKDLVEDLLRNFGVKLYTSNKSTEDLFKYFTKNTYDTSSEDTGTNPIDLILSGEQQVSQNDYQKEIYKRLYHNLPLLMKSKGTERGLRALVNCFGIPSDVLTIKLYGGQSTSASTYLGDEKPFTSSLDKIRIVDTVNLTEGSTLSESTSILKNSNELSQDLHRLEVGFSPTDNVNSYIVDQIGATTVNIDDLIGDPRDTVTNSYGALNTYANTILGDLTKYDVKDFIRLIKFFDNVIFRMIKDFVPARTVTDTGIIIKPHLLEKNKAKSVKLEVTQPEYYTEVEVGTVEGSHGESVKHTTSHEYKIDTPIAVNVTKHDKQHEEVKYTGEFSGGNIKASDGELNRDNSIKRVDSMDLFYNIGVYELPTVTCTVEALQSGNYLYSTPGANISLSSLFFGLDSSWTVSTSNGTPITLPYFTSTSVNNYDTQTLTAVNSSCPTVTSTIVYVNCNYSVNTSQSIYTNIDPTYDLEDWFNIPQGAVVVYKVDGTVVSPQYSFSGTIGNTQTLSIEDTTNPLCGAEVEVTLTNCELLTANNVNLWNIVADTTTTSPGEVQLSTVFTDASNSTTYEVRYRVTTEPVIKYGVSTVYQENTPWTAVDSGLLYGTHPYKYLKVDWMNHKTAAESEIPTSPSSNIQELKLNDTIQIQIRATEPGIGNCTVISDLLEIANGTTTFSPGTPVDLGFASGAPITITPQTATNSHPQAAYDLCTSSTVTTYYVNRHLIGDIDQYDLKEDVSGTNAGAGYYKLPSSNKTHYRNASGDWNDISYPFLPINC